MSLYLPILRDLFFAELKVKGGGDLGGSGVGMAGGGTLVSTFGKGTTPVTPKLRDENRFLSVTKLVN